MNNDAKIMEVCFQVGETGWVVAVEESEKTALLFMNTLTGCMEAEMDDEEAFDMLTKALDDAGVKYEKKEVPELGKMKPEIHAMNMRLLEEYPELVKKTECSIGLLNEGNGKYSVQWRCDNIGGVCFDTAEKAYEDLESILKTPHVIPLLMLDSDDEIAYRYATSGVFVLYQRALYCEEPNIEGLKEFFAQATGRLLLQMVCDEDEMLSRDITKEQKDAVEEVVSAIEYIARTVNGLPVAPEFIDDVPLSGCMPS